MARGPHISQAVEPKGCLFRQSQTGEYAGEPMCIMCDQEPVNCPANCTYFDMFGNAKDV